MNRKTYYNTVALVFLIVAILHLLRAINGWEATIANNIIPIWVSWVAVLVAGYLSLRGFGLARQKRFLCW